MKLFYKSIGHILSFDGGYINELVIENKKLFFEMVNSASTQINSSHGDFTLSINNKDVEFSKYADLTVEFAPFQVNRKSLITKLYAALEQNALNAENYSQSTELLSELEGFLFRISEELPFDIICSKLSVGSIIKALSPEIDDRNNSPLEKIFSYMELVRELDRDRLFIMVNMRTYFSDEDMESFIESVSLHDFKVLLLESSSFVPLKNTKRYTVDNDLCEF